MLAAHTHLTSVAGITRVAHFHNRRRASSATQAAAHHIRAGRAAIIATDNAHTGHRAATTTTTATAGAANASVWLHLLCIRQCHDCGCCCRSA